MITGASGGIGEATARAFAAAKSRVLLSARSKDRLDAITREIRKAGGDAHAFGADVTRCEDIEALFAEADSYLGGIDIMVANAGIGLFKMVDETSDQELHDVLETNLYGALRCIRAAVPRMRSAGRGQIILISSMVAKRAVPMLGLYSASKFALQGLSESLRVELSRDGIGVVVICPGITATSFHGNAINSSLEPPPPVSPMPVGKVAHAILKASRRGSREVVLTGFGKGLALLNRFAPSLLDRALTNIPLNRRTT
ncbi:MAG: SDR family NAD(P)-dependent oxidoreductase [Acidobacteria bacterium]|nr:SDR family NAD(P)-dependent oxidoreductase [Acidobacteriota bacterium]